MKRKIIWGLAAVLILIQFIRPAKNQSNSISDKDISTVYPVSAEVSGILKKACNDCHSNNTVYPWYSNIQPVAWWLQHHVDEGKGELDFSNFASYSPKKQHHKLEEVIEQVKDGEMPLNSYTWIHKDAVLTDAEKRTLSDWAATLRNEIAAKNNLPAEPEKEKK